jgi:methylglutaconyl-CoA hydratase
MSTAPLELEARGPATYVWLNRPQAHNALTPELVASLTKAFHDLARDAHVRVIVLGGRGPSFCAGVDIEHMKASGQMTPEQNLAEAEGLAGMFASVADCPKPVIVRAHGNVLGGGVGLLCAGDLPMASNDARFALTEVRLGILPALISPYVTRRIGDRNARELMLTGERVDAVHAKALGLVQSVHPAEHLDGAVRERTTALLHGAPGSQARIKTLLELYAESAWDEYRSAMPRVLAEVRAGAEAKDGLAAFLEKRPPRWSPEAAAKPLA